MANEQTSYDELIKKINSLEATLSSLKNKLKTVYTICDLHLGDKNDEQTKDIKND